MLYEILTAERPFKTTHNQPAFYSIMDEDPVPMTKIRKDIPKELERIVQKSLVKDQKKRFANMSTLISNLKSISVSMNLPSSLMPAIEKKPSIAVLPFVNMSADPENEYFSDGLAEDPISALTKITDLYVVARTSSFAFKGKK